MCTPPLLEPEFVSETVSINTPLIVSEVLPLNPPFLISLWHPVMLETTKLSATCPDFILFTISVSSSRSESHHNMTKTPRPNNTETNCSMLLQMEIADHYDRLPEVQLEEKYGWMTLKTSANLPEIFARRVSRVPKLLPQYFFPHTKVALYCDLKRLQQIQKLDAYVFAKRLLTGTQFGIVQHPSSKGVVNERDAILGSRGLRPYIVDNKDLLVTQVDFLSLMLSKTQQDSFAIEGQIFARIISNISSASAFNSLWYEEYASGSDRDQIAFFGAAARMNLHLVSSFPCPVYNRSGIYLSRSMGDFSLAIHCNLEKLLSTEPSF